MQRMFFGIASAAALASSAAAQFDPASGQWGKDDPADVRVVTWNVLDGIASNAEKSEGLTQWEALARAVALLDPDVLILQETGDTGGGVDSVSTLETTIDLFLYGGTDPFEGGEVTAYVQKYAPGFDMPYVRVASANDGFNRNATLSRYPFADLNGNGSDTENSFFQLEDGYAPGGGPGIRGFLITEIDLPDDAYAGDLVVGNSHLKAFGDGDSQQQRLEAAQNISYFLFHFYNGAGTATPNPEGTILIPNIGSEVLDEFTPIVWGGDWNEDEQTNGRKGPADWMVKAEVTGGDDGTDRDTTDAVYDDAREPFTNDRDTRGGSKLDYLAWQDSVVQVRHQFVFDSSQIPTNAIPPELSGFLIPTFVSGSASDHFPVAIDLILEPAAPACPADLDGSGVVDASDLGALIAGWGGDGEADLDGSGQVDASDLGVLIAAWGPCL